MNDKFNGRRIHELFYNKSRPHFYECDNPIVTEGEHIKQSLRDGSEVQFEYPSYSDVRSIADSVMRWLTANYCWGVEINVPRYVFGCTTLEIMVYVMDELNVHPSEWRMVEDGIVLRIMWHSFIIEGDNKLLDIDRIKLCDLKPTI